MKNMHMHINLFIYLAVKTFGYCAPADGSISSSSILLAQSMLHNLKGQSCSPTELFYQGNAQTIREWLTVAISRALHQGEDSLLELTKQICCFLQVLRVDWFCPIHILSSNCLKSIFGIFFVICCGATHKIHERGTKAYIKCKSYSLVRKTEWFKKYTLQYTWIKWCKVRNWAKV